VVNKFKIMRAKKKERKKGKERGGGPFHGSWLFPTEKYHNREGTNVGELHTDDIPGN
jgi:hypothetical protein